jgi:hypothetical protein
MAAPGWSARPELFVFVAVKPLKTAKWKLTSTFFAE